MAEKRTKRTDEIFCRSCGEPIKKEAEICPECGVRNEKASTGRTTTTTATTGASTGTSQPTSSVHDPSDYETTVSADWWYAVTFGVGAWVLYFAVATVISDGLLFGLLAFVALVGWIATPLGVYFDAQYVRANARWNPNSPVYIVGGIFPFVNVVTGAVYLYRRHETLGVP